MKAERFTAAYVMAAKLGDHSDGGGLMLRVREGSCSWVFRFTAPCRRRREMGLGMCVRGTEESAARSLALARSKAQSARELLAAGIDPIDARAEKKAEIKVEALRSKGLTMLRLFRRYHEECVEPRVSNKYARQWTYETENYCPRWFLDMPAIDVTARDVLRALREADQSGKSENKVNTLRQRMDQVMEWMIDSGIVAANAAGVRRNTRPEWVERFAGSRGAQQQQAAA